MTRLGSEEGTLYGEMTERREKDFAKRSANQSNTH